MTSSEEVPVIRSRLDLTSNHDPHTLSHFLRGVKKGAMRSAGFAEREVLKSPKARVGCV